MAFMIIAFIMAFVLKYSLAKYPYPEIQTGNTPVTSATQDVQREVDDSKA